MSKKIHRGVVATLAAGGLALSLFAPAALAVDDADPPPIDVGVPEETAQSAAVYRIADQNRILTAIEASQSRTDWGTGVTYVPEIVWDCEAPIIGGGPIQTGLPVEPPYSLGDRVQVINGVLEGDINGIVAGEIGGEFAGTLLARQAGIMQGTIEGEIDGEILGLILGVIVGQLEAEFGGDLTGTLDGQVVGLVFPPLILAGAEGEIVGQVEGEVLGELVADIGALLFAGVEADLEATYEGAFVGRVVGQVFGEFFGGFFGEIFGNFNGVFDGIGVDCEAVDGGRVFPNGRMDIILARADDYPDALAGGPLADVLNAPILLHTTDPVGFGEVLIPATRTAPPVLCLDPGGCVNPAVAAEIERLARLGTQPGEDPRGTAVHVLGGTDALSEALQLALLDIPGVDFTLRYQGIDRYETAVRISEAVVDFYGVDCGADLGEVNAYLTTGINFPDALAAGAAASGNCGVVLLTNGEELDRRGFTESFLVWLDDYVGAPGSPNLTKNYAVGGPAVRAAEAFDIRLTPGGAYLGADRYETATLAALGTYGPLGPVSGDFAVASGEGFADALVAGGFIANLDGPLLLTRADNLTPVTAAYMEQVVMNGDRIFTFGGPDALKASVTKEIADLLKAKFEIDPEIR